MAVLCSPAIAVAQSLAIRPAVVPAGDTTDHVDLTWQSVPAHGSAVLVAVRYDSSGSVSPKQTEKVVWTSSAPSIVTVSGTSGLAVIRATGYGSATITATATGKLVATMLVCSYGPGFPAGIVVVGPDSVPTNSSARYTLASTTNASFPAPCIHWLTSVQPYAASVDRRGVVTTHWPFTVDVKVTAFLGVP